MLVGARTLFVVVEGPDGAGKTTWVKYVASFLRKRGFKVSRTREPGGTKAGEEIRHTLFNKEHKLLPLSQVLLFFSDRFEHVTKVIRPKLKKGISVVSDRFWYSTVGYQIRGHQMDQCAYDLFNELREMVVGDLRPDLVILLDIDSVKGLERAADRGDGSNYFEAQDIAYHKRVRAGLKEASEEWEDGDVPYVIIDTSGTKKQTREQINQALADVWPLDCNFPNDRKDKK